MTLAGIAGFVGAVTADHDAPAIAVTAAWGVAAGMLARYGRPGAVVGALSTLALVVTQAHYLDVGPAAKHATLILAGGAVQFVLLLAWHGEHRRVPPLLLRSSLFRHALRTGLALDAATATTDSFRSVPTGTGS